MKAVMLIAFLLLTAGTAFADLKEIDNTQQFEQIIREAKVPVIVKFSAYWWGSCTTLKNTLVKVAPGYSDEQVLLCTVDAYVNSDLKKYLLQGYPTVRVFTQGKMGNQSFVGAKSEDFVKRFIDSAIKQEPMQAEAIGELKVLKTSAEFNDLIAKSQVPVIVKFSAAWWGACNVLKNTLAQVAPSYSPEQVLLCTVDADINRDLRKHLIGGAYPTVRVFNKGKTSIQSFVGSKAEPFVRQFIDKVIQQQGALAAPGELKDIKSMAEFNDIVNNSTVPVVMKISMPGWAACAKLKNTMAKVAPEYSSEQVLLCSVEISVNKELKKYALGGFPTVRVFHKGKVGGPSFLGSKDEAFLREFINKVIEKPSDGIEEEQKK